MIEIIEIIEIIVIVEAEADFKIATKLAERVLFETIEWLDEDQLQYQMQWCGLESHGHYSCWKHVSQIIETLKQTYNYRPPRYLGHDKSGPLKADGAASMKVLNVVRFLQRSRNIQAILLIRDLDNQPERRIGLEQARQQDSQRQPKLEIVLEMSDRTREAWVLNGFVPHNDNEKQVLKDIVEQLKFDPCQQAHRLHSNSNSEGDRLRNPKVVLAQLTSEDYNRERQCWEETPLELLRQRGTETGLTVYLDELEQRLRPMLSA